MIDFKIAQQHLSEMLGLMTNARTPSSDEMLDLTVFRSAARLVVTGTRLRVRRGGGAAGVRSTPPRTAAKDREDRRVLCRRSGPHPHRGSKGAHQVGHHKPPVIAKTAGRMGPIDIPDDSSTLNLLAVQAIFSPIQIEESSLSAKVYSGYFAQQKKTAAIDSAAHILAELGIRSERAWIAQKHIARHTETTRKVLTP